MRKQLATVAGVLPLVAGLGQLFAWERKASVDVPFKFLANGRILPAGRYSIGIEGQAQNIVVIRGENGETVVLPVLTRLGAADLKVAQVIFDKAGDLAYLSEVHFPGLDGFQLQGAPCEHAHVRVQDTR